jgi:hypothetical protein
VDLEALGNRLREQHTLAAHGPDCLGDAVNQLGAWLHSFRL